MRGCAGAGSTQARTPICTSPPPLALHPGLDLYGFRVLSNSDRAPVLLIVLCTCLACRKLDLSRPDGCQFGFGGGSRPLVFFRRCPGWMLPISNNWIWVCKLDLSRADGCQFGFGGGSRPLVFFRRCPDWWLPISNIGFASASWTCPDQTDASSGLGMARGLWFSSDGALTGCFQS